MYEFVRGQGWVPVKNAPEAEEIPVPKNSYDASFDLFYIYNESLCNETTVWFEASSVEDGFIEHPLALGMYRVDVYLPPSDPYWTPQDNNLYNEVDALNEIRAFERLRRDYPDWRARLVRVS